MGHPTKGMENKENNQDDLVVSSSGEMLTKDQSEKNTIEVKEAPQSPEEQPTESPVAQATDQSKSGESINTTEPPTGLAPPEITSQSKGEQTPSHPDQTHTVKSSPTPEDSSTHSSNDAGSHNASQHKEIAQQTNAAFAVQHSNQQRTLENNHHTRNNKKVLAVLIVIVAIALSGIAVFVYLQTQENVAESTVEPETTTQQIEQEEGLTNEPEVEELPLQEDATTDEVLDTNSVDEGETVESTETPQDEQTQSVEPTTEPETLPVE